METAKPTRRVMKCACWIILVAALAFSSLVRWRLAEMPLERDEGEYAYAGQLILQGIPPYSLAYTQKLPGVHLAYAGLMAVFGQTTAGIHLGLLVVNLATIVLIFFLARDLFDPMTGAVAAASYAILSTSYTVLGQAAHATHFVALFGVAGVWGLWRTLKGTVPFSPTRKSGQSPDRPLPRLFAAGLLLGTALLMKQHAVFLLCFGGLATLLWGARRRPFSWRWLLATCSLYVVGALLPYALVCLWLWLAGTFHNFWFWTVVYAQACMEQEPLSAAPSKFWTGCENVVGMYWPLWTLALVGVISLLWPRREAAFLVRWGETMLKVVISRAPELHPERARRLMFIFGFLLFSFLCVCPSFHFREHYFIVLLPCVAVLAGVGAVGIVGTASRLSLYPVHEPAIPAPINMSVDRPAVALSKLLIVLAVLLSTAAMVLPVWSQRDFYFSWPPMKVSLQIYGANPFVECSVIADYLKRHTSPNDRVAVLGSEPEIPFYAKRKSATGHINVYPLVELQPYAGRMQEEMIREIEAAKPKYLVIVSVPTSWTVYPGCDKSIFAWMDRYAQNYYRRVGLIDLGDETDYKWDDQIVGARPRSKCYLWVLQRKP